MNKNKVVAIGMMSAAAVVSTILAHAFADERKINKKVESLKGIAEKAVGTCLEEIKLSVEDAALVAATPVDEIQLDEEEENPTGQEVDKED